MKAKNYFSTLTLTLLLMSAFTFDLQSQKVWEKYEYNPVLDIGEPDDWDYHGAYGPRVIHYNNEYWMYYAGFASGIFQVGLATSDDGKTWTKDLANPIIPNGDEGSWYENIAADFILNQNDTLKMWYDGWAEGETNYQIGYAWSVDGKNWNLSDAPVLTTGSEGEWDERYVFGASVVYDGAIYHMWYTGAANEGNSKIGYATSTDGIAWTKYASNPVIDYGEFGSFYDSWVSFPYVIYDDGKYKMWFNGGDGIYNRLGYAESLDGADWDVFRFAVINPGKLGAWDSRHVHAPCVMMEDDIYKMWFGGNFMSFWRTGYAEGFKVIDVPGDYENIQDGIDAAMDGEVVLVDTGTYYENINYKGKAITVASNFIVTNDSILVNETTIDGSMAKNADSASVVSFVSGEDTTSVLNGFTITGGTGTYLTTYQSRNGGGILCWESGATIINNMIINNEINESNKAGGAGISCFKSEGTYFTIFENNLVRNNKTIADGFSAYGAGIHLATNARIKSNWIDQNSCFNTNEVDGAGITIEQVGNKEITVDIHDNLITDNTLEGFNTYGAGIYVFKAKANITDNIITNNSFLAESAGRGVGIGYGQVIADIFINGNTISNNVGTANLAHGGGIFVGFGYVEGILELSNNEISNNSLNAYRAWGAGINIESTEKQHFINNNTVEGNFITADDFWAGSGMWLISPMASIQIKNNDFINNSGNPGSSYGGGIGLSCGFSFEEPLLVDGNIISENTANYGGGIFIINTIAPQIYNNVFHKNEASVRGGGIMLRDSNSDNSMIFNKLISENDKQSKKSILENETLRPLIFNNDFLYGTASVGGAIYTDYITSIPIVLNSIFYGNQAGAADQIYNLSSVPIIISYNDIDENGISGKWDGEENIYVDPILEEDSIHLFFDSECINAGTPFIEANEINYYCPPSDIDGDDRPYDNTAPDIGADESPYHYVKIEENNLAEELVLHVYPNPFSNSTTIGYKLRKSSAFQIIIINHLGTQVELIEQNQSAGNQQIIWNAEGLPAGVYFCVLKTEIGMHSTKMIKLK